MIELAGLVTRREKQGRGYGSALVRAVTQFASVFGVLRHESMLVY